MSPQLPGSSLEAKFARFARKGDSRALGQVFDQLAPELFALAAHLTRHPAEAEDLVSETFVSAIEVAERYDPKRPLRPWLVGILVRVRRRRMRSASRIVEPDRVVQPRAADPISVTQGNELDESLVVALEHVPDTYREVLRLHLFEDCKPREIAKRLGRAGGTVRVQLHRGLDMLKRSLPTGFQPASLSAVLPAGHLAGMKEQVMAAASTFTPPPAAPILPARAAAGAIVVIAGTAVVAPTIKGSEGAHRTEPVVLQGTTRLVADLEPLEQPAQAAEERAQLSMPTSASLAATHHEEVGQRRAASRVRRKSKEDEKSVPTGPLPYFVSGIVSTEHHADLSQATIRIRDDGEILSEGSVAEDGTFRVAVNRTSEDRGHVDLMVDHPAFAVAIEPLALAAGQFMEEPKPHLLLTQGAWLSPPATRLRGRITVPGAGYVGLFHEANDKPTAEALDECELVDGRYELRVPKNGDYVLVADVRGHQPAHQVLPVRRAMAPRFTPPPFEFERGRLVDFHVQLPTGVNASRVKLEVRPARFTRALKWRNLYWRDTCVRGSERFSVDSGGNLQTHVPEMDLDVVLHDVPALTEPTEKQRLRALQTFCNIVPPVGLLELRLADEDGALAGVRLELTIMRFENDYDTAKSTDDLGHARFVLPSGRGVFGQFMTEHGYHEFNLSTPGPGLTVSKRILGTPSTAKKR